MFIWSVTASIRTIRLPSTLLLAGVGAVLLAACGGDDSAPATPAPAPVPVAPPPPEPGEPETARYAFAQPEVRISPRIPGTLPEGVHFAPPIALVAHARDAAPFALGEAASDGLKVLAEQGAAEAFLAEAEAASAEVIAASFAELLAIFLSPDPSIELRLEQPCLTYAQMIAPTPDWFIGFTNVCATDEDGKWLDEIGAELLAYDAGTAEGDDFALKAEGGDTEPRDPVSLLDQPPWFPAPSVVQVLTATRGTE